MKITTDTGEDVTETVQQLYDMAVSSMDYGSGMLSTEEMASLVRMADLLDADDKLNVHASYRMMIFPQGFMAKPHDFEPDRPLGPWAEGPRCLVCGAPMKGSPYNHGSKVYSDVELKTVEEQIEAHWQYLQYSRALQRAGAQVIRDENGKIIW